MVRSAYKPMPSHASFKLITTLMLSFSCILSSSTSLSVLHQLYELVDRLGPYLMKGLIDDPIQASLLID